VESSIKRKSRHPEEGDRISHQCTSDFDILEESGILLSKEHHTLAAIFSGDFALPVRATTALKKILRDWREDVQARVPHKGLRRRSYDDGTFVSTQISFVVVQ
jgi:hypothetical protein